MDPGNRSAEATNAPAAELLPDGTVVMAQAVLPVWGRQLDVIHEQLNAGITELTQAVASLMATQNELSAADLRDPANLVRWQADWLPRLQGQTEHALAGLQIGDRLSQMLAVVRGDIQRLVEEMPLLGEAGQLRAQAWLDELRERYTTPEQHEVHDPNAPPPAASGVDYF